MSEQIRQQLQIIYDLIKTGRTQEAHNALQPILTGPNSMENFEAWWLSAIIANAPNEKRDALRRVLKAKPDHIGARQMLDALDALEAYDKPKSDRRVMRTGSESMERPPLAVLVGSIVTESPPDWLDPSYNPPYQPALTRKKKKEANHISRRAFILLAISVAFTTAAIGFSITYYRFRDASDIAHRHNLLLTQAAQIDPPPQLTDTIADMHVRELKTDVWQDGALEVYGQDLWHFYAGQPEIMKLAVNSGSDSLTPIVGLYNAKYGLLASPRERNGKDKLLNFTIPAAGDYYVLIAGLGGTEGAYHMRLDIEPIP